MIKFFKDLEDLHRFTQSLDFHQNMTQCHKCSKHDQFVSHGFVYKKQHQGDKKIVGKRILCSNRYGRVGCGSTHRLYLAGQIPNLQYDTEHVFQFLLELIACVCIQAAYKKATGSDNPRHAYRWLNRLDAKLTDYRNLIVKQWQNQSTLLKSHTQRFQLLLPTCQLMFVTLGQQACSQYQLLKQTGFI